VLVRVVTLQACHLPRSVRHSATLEQGLTQFVSFGVVVKLKRRRTGLGVRRGWQRSIFVRRVSRLVHSHTTIARSVLYESLSGTLSSAIAQLSALTTL
jgi:hypothetical protein